MSQCERLLEAMERGEAFTSESAKERLGIARLASRVNDLKNQGYEIEKKWIKGKNRYGEPCKWLEYRLKGDDE